MTSLKKLVPFDFSVFILISGTAFLVRSDRGNENLNIAAMQRFFRRNCNDSMAGYKSFMFGRSTANQVIFFIFESLLFGCTTSFFNILL